MTISAPQAPQLRLQTKSLANGTYGELFLDNTRLCYTVEREWNNNAPNVSCIPGGVYLVRRHQSPKFGDCFSLENKALGVTVFGPSQRTHCLIHAANWPSQLSGCIAPGTTLHSSRWGVGNSKTALNALKKRLGNSEWQMEIIRL